MARATGTTTSTVSGVQCRPRDMTRQTGRGWESHSGCWDPSGNLVCYTASLRDSCVAQKACQIVASRNASRRHFGARRVRVDGQSAQFRRHRFRLVPTGRMAPSREVPRSVVLGLAHRQRRRAPHHDPALEKVGVARRRTGKRAVQHRGCRSDGWIQVRKLVLQLEVVDREC